MIALGSSKDIDQLCVWLQHGPALARVDEVMEETIDDPGLTGFTTR